MNEYTFSLPRLWLIAAVICVLDVLSMFPSFGTTYQLLMLFPGRIWGVASIFVPPAVGAIWLLLMVLGLKFHGFKGLQLLLALIVILPASLVWWINWICVTRGACL